MADRGGGAEERFVGDAGQVRDDFLDLAGVGVGLSADFERDSALLAAELLLEDTGAGHARGRRVVVHHEFQADGGAMILGRSPGSQRLELRG